MRVMTLKAVVFPAPFGPISPAISPCSTSSETSSSATTPPKRRVTFRSFSNGGTGLGSAVRQVEQPAEHARPVDAQAVVLVLVRQPGAQAADGRGRLLGKRALHVHVLRVDRGRSGNVVRLQPLGIVELRPIVVGEEPGRF